MEARAFALAVVWAALFVDYSLMTVVIPIFPVLNAGTVATGVLFSSKAAVQIFSAPFVAGVVDKWGWRPLKLGLVIEIFTTVVFAFTESYNVWFVCRATQGFASACIISSGFLQIQKANQGDNEALGKAMGTVTTGIISGVVFGPSVGGLLYGIWAPLPFFGLAGLAAAVLAAACALTCAAGDTARVTEPEADSLGAKAADEGSTWSKARGLAYDWQILLVLGALFFANAAISCLEATIGMFAEKPPLELGPTDVGILFTLAAIPSVTGAKISGGLGVRFGRWRVILAGMLIQGAFFALSPKDQVPVMLTSMVGLGLGMGLVDGTAPSMLARRSELRHHGTGVVYTMATVATQLGFLLGPVGGSGVMAAYGFQTMSQLLGLLMCLYAPLFLCLRKTGEEQQQEEHEAGLTAGGARGGGGVGADEAESLLSSDEGSPRAGASSSGKGHL